MNNAIYTGFSNYKEFNIQKRKEAAQDDIRSWEERQEEYKEYRLEWSQSANTSFLPHRPLNVDIEVSDACNLKCQMCAHGIGTVNNVGTMKTDLAYRLIDECVELKVPSIKFIWRGEPTLHKDLPQLVKYAKDKGILEVGINTNGISPHENMFISLAEAGIDRLIFSVDGFSKESFEAIRIKGDYGVLWDNIHELIQWKKDNNKIKPLIRVQMVRQKLNAHEVDAFLDYWNGKVEDVRISDVMNRGQGNSFAMGEQITVGRRRCPQPFQRLVIARDGRVSPCCADWDQKYIVGDVNKGDTLRKLWNDKGMKKIRDIQDKLEHDKIDICKNCYVKESYIWDFKEK